MVFVVEAVVGAGVRVGVPQCFTATAQGGQLPSLLAHLLLQVASQCVQVSETFITRRPGV